MNAPALPAWTQAVTLGCVEEEVEVVVCPPYTQLAAAQMVLTGTPIALGAQNCHQEASGAYTGEISAEMVRRSGCHYVIVGHSERREYYQETDEMVRAKAEAVQKQGLTPIVCVGESLHEREAGEALSVIGGQLERSLPGDDDYIVAYEPVWAIGTGKTPTLDDIAEVHEFIKKQLNNDVPVVYGGSVKPANAEEIMAMDAVNGVLVGGASLDGESFAQIVVAGAKA